MTREMRLCCLSSSPIGPLHMRPLCRNAEPAHKRRQIGADIAQIMRGRIVFATIAAFFWVRLSMLLIAALIS